MTDAASPLRAFAHGVVDVLKAPLILLSVAAITLLIALPFAAVLHSRLEASLSVQPHVNLDDTEIDPEWWREFREQARGLEASFTPAVLGFAATLDGLSGLLDGRRLPAAILLPVALSVVAWAFLWGGVLERYRRGRAIGAAAFARAGFRTWIRFCLIAIAAAVINVLLFLTLHRVLFGPVHSALVAMTSTERDAFVVRVLLYLVFMSCVGLVSLIADYARVAAVSGHGESFAATVRTAAAFVRRRLVAVIALYLVTGLIFVTVTVAYGTLEIYGGSQVGGWRAIAIGQAYVLVRLALRLTFAASELRLFNTNQAVTAQ